MARAEWLGANYRLLWILGVCLSACVAAPLLRTKIEVDNVFINAEHEQSCGHQINFTVNDSCQFYDHCIDQHFPCKEFGFTLRYAKKRCQAIIEVQKEEFTSAHIHHWTMLHETCLRRKLLQLLQAFTNSSKPDSPVCLQMETLAFKAVEECYNETHESFCPSESNGLTFELTDSLLLAQLFSLNDSYYEHTVKQGLSKLFRTCNHTSLDAASTDLEGQAPRRAVICARHYNNDIGDIESGRPLILGEEYVKNVSLFRKIPAEQLVYGGHVLHSEGGECFKSAKSYVRDGRVHLIIWSVPPEKTVNYPMHTIRYFGDNSLEMWYSEGLHTEGECGDGVRQATEMCDVGVFFGLSYACTADCQWWDGFECFSDPLTRSLCWKQECGNGRRTSDEECDDGNTENNDGCSSDCQVELEWNCTDFYLQQSTCIQTPPMPPSTPTPTPPSPPSNSNSPPPGDTIRNSAEVASKHLIVMVVSVFAALVVSSALSSALPGTGIAGGRETHDDTSVTEHDQRKLEGALSVPERPCWDATGDCVTQCIPHEDSSVPLTASSER